MLCPRCRHDNPPDAAFCDECGARLETPCPRCGEPNRRAAKFCGKCGHALAAAGAPTPAPRGSPESYTPQHLAEKILTSRSALEGERKQVTVLFADLKGSMELLADRDPEDARKLLDPVLERMMEAVHRYEGTVNQVLGDGIMALFGAPVAHEDHAVRACYAALRMQAAVRRYAEEVHRREAVPVQIRVGLNSGEVLVRSIGSDLHMDYTAVGQTTHLAARVEQMATPGTILIPRATLALVEGWVQVRPLGPRPVKGLEAPVEVFEVLAAGPVRSRLQAAAARGLTRFVGRDAERAQLGHALERAGAGHGQVLAIVGEPGVGKSRLAWEVARSPRAEGWLILASAAVAHGMATPHLPLIDLLTAYFKLRDGDAPRETREKVTGKLLALDPALASEVPVCLTLLGVPVDDPSWRALDPPQRRERVLDGVKRLLLRESRVQPVLLVIEDLQWVDSETQAWLDSLVESLPAARVLLLVNHRPEYVHGWAGKTYHTRLRLDPLPPASADALLDGLVGTDASVRPLKRMLIERTEGNPFFLEESVRALLETHALVGDRGAYRLARSPEEIRVPPTVQAVLAARIDRLLPEDKRLLEEAAVLGRAVPLRLLSAVVDRPDETLRHSLARLQAAELLDETALFPDPEYTFKHALTLDVAYQGLVRERRQALHRRALAALEAMADERRGDQVERLAHHAVAGEAWEEAARYQYRAGEKAVAQARYRAADDCFTAALGALDRMGAGADRTLRLDACLELWAARVATGALETLPALADEAEALARALGDEPRLAQVQVRQAQGMAGTDVLPGTLEAALEKAREAAARADPRDLRTRAYARFLAGLASRDLGRLADAIREYDHGVGLFPALPDQPDDAWLVFPIHVSLCAWRSEAHAATGDFERALASAGQARDMAARLGHPTSLIVADAFAGFAHMTRGRLEAALPLLERGLRLSEEHASVVGVTGISLYLAVCHLTLGDRVLGLEHLARASERPGASFWLQFTRYGTVTAGAWLAAGRPDLAHAAIDRGLAEVAEHRALAYRAPLLRLQAEARLAEAPGDADPARALLDEALELAGAQNLRPLVAHCHLGLGRLRRQAGDHTAAAAHLAAAAALYREMGMARWLETAEVARSE